MRQKWARIIALVTAMIILLLAAVFALMQNPIDPPGITEDMESRSSTERLETIVLDPHRIEAGRRVYQQQSCARCHSIAGNGNPRSPLDGVGERRNTEELRDWIIGANALQGVLPERVFELKQDFSNLAPDNLDLLVIYIQSLPPE